MSSLAALTAGDPGFQPGFQPGFEDADFPLAAEAVASFLGIVDGPVRGGAHPPPEPDDPLRSLMVDGQVQTGDLRLPPLRCRESDPAGGCVGLAWWGSRVVVGAPKAAHAEEVSMSGPVDACGLPPELGFGDLPASVGEPSSESPKYRNGSVAI